MTPFVEQLEARVLQLITSHDCRRVALVGFTPVAAVLHARLIQAGLGDRLIGIFDPRVTGREDPGPLHLHAELHPDLLVICADAEKEPLLDQLRELIADRQPLPRVALAGTGHLEYSDPTFDELDSPALVPSYATGSPHTRTHLFQCLKAAADNALSGAIVEFGAFKGGTTAWLARTAQKLGLRDSKVIGFDTWSGFPPRRSLLDLYEHPRCVFSDVEAVRAYTAPLGIELVAGDIAQTCECLTGEPLLLCFFDTDNYTPTRTALELCVEQVVPGGAIVFDHVVTAPEYIDTIGERMAAREVLTGRGLLNLHGTGVFLRLR